MATLQKNKPTGTPAPLVPSGPDAILARELLVRPPKPFFLRSWFGLALGLIIVASVVFSWRASEIDPGTLVTKSGNFGRIALQIFQPDIVTHDQARIELAVQQIVGAAKADPNAQAVKAGEILLPNVLAGQTIREEPLNEPYNAAVDISTGTVAPGQEISVTGTGFRPNTPGKVLWRSTGQSASIQELGAFNTDAQGKFTGKVLVPADADRVLNSSGFPNTIAFQQSWDYGSPYLSSTVELVRDRMLQTIAVALMGTVFAVIFSVPLSFLAARNIMGNRPVGKIVYFAARTFLNIVRSIEVVILAVIFAAAVGLGPFAGMLALVVYATASLGKLFSEAIESIDPGPIEALTATGANRLQVINYAVIPQFIPAFISFTLYTWDRNVRMSTVIGLVGGGGIGFLLIQFINLLQWNQAGTVLFAIALVVVLLDWASARIRQAVI